MGNIVLLDIIERIKTSNICVTFSKKGGELPPFEKILYFFFKNIKIKEFIERSANVVEPQLKKYYSLLSKNMDGLTDPRTHGLTNRQTDKRTDGESNI